MVMYSPPWRAWITKKHLDAVNRCEEMAAGFEQFGDVGKAAAAEFRRLRDMLNAEPPD